ncbi:MAG: hypothetical protein [Inoviridae sp.]|nr:MAG: hypothetical protein [Inoviridae sp.]
MSVAGKDTTHNADYTTSKKENDREQQKRTTGNRSSSLSHTSENFRKSSSQISQKRSHSTYLRTSHKFLPPNEANYIFSTPERERPVIETTEKAKQKKEN